MNDTLRTVGLALGVAGPMAWTGLQASQRFENGSAAESLLGGAIVAVIIWGAFAWIATTQRHDATRAELLRLQHQVARTLP